MFRPMTMTSMQGPMDLCLDKMKAAVKTVGHALASKIVKVANYVGAQVKIALPTLDPTKKATTDKLQGTFVCYYEADDKQAKGKTLSDRELLNKMNQNMRRDLGLDKPEQVATNALVDVLADDFDVLSLDALDECATHSESLDQLGLELLDHLYAKLEQCSCRVSALLTMQQKLMDSQTARAETLTMISKTLNEALQEYQEANDSFDNAKDMVACHNG